MIEVIKKEVIDRMIKGIEKGDVGKNKEGENKEDIEVESDIIKSKEGIGERRLILSEWIEEIWSKMKREKMKSIVDIEIESGDKKSDIVKKRKLRERIDYKIRNGGVKDENERK